MGSCCHSRMTDLCLVTSCCCLFSPFHSPLRGLTAVQRIILLSSPQTSWIPLITSLWPIYSGHNVIPQWSVSLPFRLRTPGKQEGWGQTSLGSLATENVWVINACACAHESLCCGHQATGQSCNQLPGREAREGESPGFPAGQWTLMGRMVRDVPYYKIQWFLVLLCHRRLQSTSFFFF